MNRIGYWIDTHRTLLVTVVIVLEVTLMALVAREPTGGVMGVIVAFLLGLATPGLRQWCHRLDTETRTQKENS